MIPQHPPVPAIPRKLGLHLGLRLGSKVGVSAVTGAPTITSGNTANNVENTVLAHALTANEGVTWSIRTAVQNGASVDHDKFELSGSTLRWASNGTKDYETPNDTGSNNTYVVVVRATDVDEGLTTDQTITVTVTDSAPATPTLTWTSGTAAYDPTFSLTEIAEDDVVELQIDDVNTFTSLFDSDTNTIDAAEALSGSLTFAGISSLTPGTTFYARARYQRDGEYSAWSNIVSKAMDAASFSPEDIFTRWWDASTGLATSGANVTGWTDRIGSVATSSVTGSPQYNATGLDGGPCVVFDGDDALVAALPSNTGATATLAVIGTITGGTGGGRAASVLSSGGGRDYQFAEHAIIQRAGSGDNLHSYRNSQASGNVAVTLDTPFIAIARWSAAAAKFQAGSTTGTNGAAEAGSFAIDQLFIGAGRESVNPTYFHIGKISDVMYAPTALADGDIADLVTWAAAERGT